MIECSIYHDIYIYREHLWMGAVKMNALMEGA